MLRKLVQMICLILLLQSQQATACGECFRSTECRGIVSSDMVEPCGDSGGDRGFLDPYNDSRANLMLLYAAATGQTAKWDRYDYKEEEKRHKAQADAYSIRLAKLVPGEKAKKIDAWDAISCSSNTYPAASDFLDALAASEIPAPTQQQLATLRNRMLCDTTGNGGMDMFLAGIDAVHGGEFAAYLRAATLFYATRHDEALQTLAGLEKASNDWVRESATLLTARSYMVRAQRNWDGYQENAASIDQADISRSRETLERYLASYPSGRYRTSATGLLRRSQYLAGDRIAYQASFIKAWQAAVQARMPSTQIQALINEAELATPYIAITINEGHLSGGMPIDGLLHAAGILEFLRTRAAGDKDRLIRRHLQTHAELYAVVPGLQPFLLASDAAAHGDWDAVLTTATRARTTAPPLINTSAALLQARALERQQRWSEALATWRYLHKQNSGDTAAIAAGYTLTALLARQPERLWEKGAPNLDDPEITSYAIRRFLSVDQLGALIAREDLPAEWQGKLADTRMIRHLIRQDWTGFLQDYAAASPLDRAAYVPAETAARTLARQPDDPKGLLNAGFFLMEQADRISELRHCSSDLSIDAALSSIVPAEYRSPRGRNFDGIDYVRPASYFRYAIAQKPGGDLEAKLLYHGVTCFSPAWRYGCADDTVPEEMRRQWFQELKKRHPESPWAKKLKYWW